MLSYVILTAYFTPVYLVANEEHHIDMLIRLKTWVSASNMCQLFPSLSIYSNFWEFCALNNQYSQRLWVNVSEDSDSVTSVLTWSLAYWCFPKSPESLSELCCYGNFVMKLQSFPHPFCWSHKWSLMESFGWSLELELQLRAILKWFTAPKHHNPSVSSALPKFIVCIFSLYV